MDILAVVIIFGKHKENSILVIIPLKRYGESEVMRRIREDYPDKQCLPCDQWSGHTCGESWVKTKSGINHKKFFLRLLKGDRDGENTY